MKKLFFITIMLCIILTSTSAGPVSFGIGNFSRSSISLSEGIRIEDFDSPNHWSLGTEIRLNLFFIEFMANGTFSNIIWRNDGNITGVTHNGWFDGMMTLGVNAKLFGFLDIGTGFGPLYGFMFLPDEVRVMTVSPEYWSTSPDNTFMDIFTESIMGYRAHIDIHIKKLSFGLSLEVPTVGFTLSNPDVELLDVNLERSRVGLTAMYWLL
jgi:hypothetical protein